MLLAFTTRRMVRSAHLAFPPTRYTAQFDCAERLGLDVVTCAEMSRSRLPSDAVCIYDTMYVIQKT